MRTENYCFLNQLQKNTNWKAEDLASNCMHSIKAKVEFFLVAIIVQVLFTCSEIRYISSYLNDIPFIVSGVSVISYFIWRSAIFCGFFFHHIWGFTKVGAHYRTGAAEVINGITGRYGSCRLQLDIFIQNSESKHSKIFHHTTYYQKACLLPTRDKFSGRCQNAFQLY